MQQKRASPSHQIPRKTFQFPKFNPRKSFQIISHPCAAVVGGADEPLARETEQCQHLRGFKPAAQGPRGQDQAHGLGCMWAALPHLRQKGPDHGQPGTEFCSQVQWRFKPGSYRSQVPSAPKTGQGCCSSSPPCSLLAHLSSPAPAPPVSLLLSLAWGLPDACLLLVWDPVEPFPMHVKAVHSPAKTSFFFFQAEPGHILLPMETWLSCGIRSSAKTPIHVCPQFCGGWDELPALGQVHVCLSCPGLAVGSWLFQSPKRCHAGAPGEALGNLSLAAGV